MMFDTVEADTNTYYARMERLEREDEVGVAIALEEVQDDYFKAPLSDIAELATPEEIVALYTRCPNPMTSDYGPEREEPLSVFDVLEVERTGKGASEEYISEQGFEFLPSRILRQLQKREAKRRYDEHPNRYSLC